MELVEPADRSSVKCPSLTTIEQCSQHYGLIHGNLRFSGHVVHTPQPPLQLAEGTACLGQVGCNVTTMLQLHTVIHAIVHTLKNFNSNFPLAWVSQSSSKGARFLARQDKCLLQQSTNNVKALDRQKIAVVSKRTVKSYTRWQKMAKRITFAMGWGTMPHFQVYTTRIYEHILKLLIVLSYRIYSRISRKI